MNSRSNQKRFLGCKEKSITWFFRIFFNIFIITFSNYFIAL